MWDEAEVSMLGWRVWYDDESVFVSSRSVWVDLPADGLLVKIIYYSGGGKQVQMGMDFYFVAPHASGEEIHATGNVLADIESRYPGAVIKRGRWGPDMLYKRVCEEAMASTWTS